MKRPERSLANRPSRRGRPHDRGAPDDGPCLSASTALVRVTGSPGHGSGLMPARSCACGSGLRGRRNWHGNCNARLGCRVHRLPQGGVRRPRDGQACHPAPADNGVARGAGFAGGWRGARQPRGNAAASSVPGEPGEKG
jgi:hypothetical protein